MPRCTVGRAPTMAAQRASCGLMLAPRGVGVLVGVACANLLRRWWTDRTLIGVGLAGAAVSVWLVSGFSLQVGMDTIIEVGIAQGFFYGVMFGPLTTATFATLAPALRTDRAALTQLVRQLAGGIGIAVTFGMLTRGSHGAELELATRVSPAAPAWQDLLDSAGSAAPVVIAQEVSRQAAMLAYLEVVALMAVALMAVALLLIPPLLIPPLLVTLRRGRGTGAAAPP